MPRFFVALTCFISLNASSVTLDDLAVKISPMSPIQKDSRTILNQNTDRKNELGSSVIEQTPHGKNLGDPKVADRPRLGWCDGKAIFDQAALDGCEARRAAAVPRWETQTRNAPGTIGFLSAPPVPGTNEH